MKLILIALIFCLAVNAFKIDIPAYNKGFSEKLDLNAMESEALTTCLSSVDKAIGYFTSFYKDNWEQGEYFTFMTNLVKLYKAIQEATIPKCQIFFITILYNFQEKPNSMFFPLDFFQNMEIYGVEVHQQMLGMIQALWEENFLKVGQIQATILQIGAGIIKPEVPETLTVDPSQIQKFDFNKFVNQYFDAYVLATRKSLDKNSTDLLKKCSITLNDNSLHIGEMIRNLAELDSIENQLLSTKGLYSKIVDTIIPCLKALKNEAAFFETLLPSPLEKQPSEEALEEEKISFYDHVASQLVDVILFKQSQRMISSQNHYINLGEYSKAGELLGTSILDAIQRPDKLIGDI